MATEVIMPKVDMDQETGTVVEWLYSEGDTVKKGEILLVIETDKVAIDVEAPGTGVLQAISVQPGDTVPIATVIAYILAEGEPLPEQASPAPAAAVVETPPTTSQSTTSTTPATPVARNMAAAAGVPLDSVAGSGPGGKITRADVEAVIQPAPSGNGRPSGVINATPKARRLAREQNVNLSTIDGSGPAGRIQADDVLAAAAMPEPVAAPAAPLAIRGEDDIVPLVGMRRTIAERLTASYQQVPHITFTARVDMTGFNDARAELNELAEKANSARISATALFVKAVASLLTRHRWLNSSLRDDAIHLRSNVNIGVAVALEEGLIVPVVHDADRKGISQIAAEVNDLATRARAGLLVPSEVSDGTFTISNLGPFGVEQFSAIINPPQAAILAIGATQPEAVPLPDGQIVARPIMRVTLAADHRVVDGAIAAHFITDLKAVLEAPMLLLW